MRLLTLLVVSISLLVPIEIRAQSFFEEGFDLYSTGQTSKAKQYFIEGLSGDPDNGLGHYYLAKILEQENDYKGAYSHYKRAASLILDTPEGRDSLVSLKLILPEVFPAKKRSLDLIKRWTSGYLLFSSRTHHFCARIATYEYRTSDEDYGFEVGNAKIRLWAMNRKSRQIQNSLGNYALRWTSDDEIQLVAKSDTDLASKYFPTMTPRETDGKLTLNSQNINDSSSAGEIHISGTYIDSKNTCWNISGYSPPI
jgi:tetratricopeptide (TPR) repeat protein